MKLSNATAFISMRYRASFFNGSCSTKADVNVGNLPPESVKSESLEKQRMN